MGGRRRKSSASVSWPVGMLAAYGTRSRSLVVHHHGQMQANAVSQRAAWVLVPRPLNYRLSDAASTRVAPRHGGAPVSGAYWMYEASRTLSRSLAMRHHAWMLANAVSQRAAWVLVPRPLNYRLSDAASTRVAPRHGGAPVSGAYWMYEASRTLSRSLAMRHHAWMLANAVSQRAAWVLVPRPLNYRLSDAASTRVAPRNGGICFGGRQEA